MNPTLYDILGVRPQATPDEIKRAWRDAADRFEPGSGSSGAQFRLFNEAAEVLLDPAKRAEYDARLADEARHRPDRRACREAGQGEEAREGAQDPPGAEPRRGAGARRGEAGPPRRCPREGARRRCCWPCSARSRWCSW